MAHARRLLSLFVLLALAPSASAADIFVDSETDDGSGGCTLREAVASANTNTAVGGCTSGAAGVDLVRITVPTVTLTSTITLTETAGIIGPVSGAVVEMAGTGQVFFAQEPSAAVQLQYLTVRGGNALIGAGLLVDDNVVAHVYDTTFEGNVASTAGGGSEPRGGAIHARGGASLDVRRCTFVGNRASGTAAQGGAIYATFATVSVLESTFTDNRSLGAGGSGGAIYRRGSSASPLFITDSELTRNRSRGAGGAVYTAGDATISGTTFSRNTALGGTGQGGALYVSGVTFNRATVEITGGGLLFNAADQGGGLVVATNATVTLTDANVRGNQAVGDADGQGGGGALVRGQPVYLGELTVSGGTFFNNRAVGALGTGGGILNAGGAVTLTDGVVIDRNRAATAGGGVAVTNPEGAGGTHVTADDATFSGNRVAGTPGDGGGLWANGAGVEALIGAVLFDDNDVRGSGGGLWIGGGALLEATGLSATNNVARGDAADQGGGGLAIDGALTSTVRFGTFTGNRAIGGLGAGGGIHAKDGTLRLEASTVSGNYGNRGGGGAAVADGGRLETLVSNDALTVIEQNTTGRTTGDGAGVIVLEGGSAVLERPLVQYNEAWGHGGALWCAGQSTCTVLEARLESNVARLDGGGIFQAGGPASNALLVDRSLLLLNQSERGNGGGLYVEAGGTATVQNSSLGGNVARIGGGVYSTGASVTFDSATIVANEAELAGGGLGNDDGNDRPVTVGNSILFANTAPNAPNLTGRYTSAGFNVVATAEPAARFPALATDQMATNPGISSLNANGGPTRTFALTAASPAVDAGSTALAVDQRNYGRDGSPDVGAYERGASAVDAPVATRETLLGDAAPARVAAAGLEAPEALAPVRLEAPAPNPTAGRASTRITVAEAQRVTVAVYDVTGRRVATPFEGGLEAGVPAEVAVEASGLAAGVYVVVVEGETVRASTRLSVAR